MRIRRPGKAWIVLALLGALVSLLPPQGWALCVEADGHVAVEPLCDGEDAATIPETGDPSDDCGPCVDVVIAVGSPIQPAKNLRSLLLQAAPGFAVPVAGPIDYASVMTRVTPPPPASVAASAILPQRAILLI